jgi:virulence-associated protein VagC
MKVAADWPEQAAQNGVPDGCPICYRLSMSNSRSENTRTAALFRNAHNMAVRFPTDWISPDSGIRDVTLVRSGDCITIIPNRDGADPLAAFLGSIASSPIPASELDAWDDDPRTPATADVTL